MSAEAMQFTEWRDQELLRQAEIPIDEVRPDVLGFFEDNPHVTHVQVTVDGPTWKVRQCWTWIRHVDLAGRLLESLERSPLAERIRREGASDSQAPITPITSGESGG